MRPKKLIAIKKLGSYAPNMHCFNLTKAKASRDRSAAASALVPVIESAVVGVEAAALEVVAYAVGAAVWRGFQVKDH